MSRHTRTRCTTTTQWRSGWSSKTTRLIGRRLLPTATGHLKLGGFTQQVVIAYHALVADKATKSAAPTMLESRPRQELRGSRPLVWATGQPCADTTARLFGHWFTRLLAPWLMAVTEGAECEARWVTWFHFVIDFMLETGTRLRPPVYWAGGWQNPATGAGAGLFRWDLQKQSRWFARQVRHAVRHTGGNLQTST